MSDNEHQLVTTMLISRNGIVVCELQLHFIIDVTWQYVEDELEMIIINK